MEGLTEVLTVLGVLVSGFAQKHLMPKLSNNMIPFVNMGLGMLATWIAAHTGAIEVPIATTLGTGAVLGGFPTVLHQMGKILNKGFAVAPK